jgi:hypothetical protein
MSYYTAEQVPVYDLLAGSFAICDRWYSSLPTDTWPNRLYAITGGSPAAPHRVKSATSEEPVGPFSVGLFPNPACQFPSTGLSSDHVRGGVVGRPRWMFSWQVRQTTRVLRRLLAMRCTHAGLSGRPGRLRSASLRMW